MAKHDNTIRPEVRAFRGAVASVVTIAHGFTTPLDTTELERAADALIATAK